LESAMLCHSLTESVRRANSERKAGYACSRSISPQPRFRSVRFLRQDRHAKLKTRHSDLLLTIPFSTCYPIKRAPAQCAISPLNPDFRPSIAELMPSSHPFNRITIEAV